MAKFARHDDGIVLETRHDEIYEWPHGPAPGVAMRHRILPPEPEGGYDPASGIDPGDVMTWPQGPAVIEPRYPADTAWALCPEEVEAGWRIDAGIFSPPPPAPAPTKAELTAYAADTRWRIETGGIVVGGVPVATDDRSKVMILGARSAARADPDWTTVWHGRDGGAYPLDAAAMVALSNAVEAHVNGTFARFATIKAGIDAGTIITADAVDAAFAAP